MSNLSKHQAMENWVQSFLANKYLYFESATNFAGIRKIITNYGDYVRRTDVLGNKYKSYSFAFVGYEQLSDGTDGTNIDNMENFDAFLDWLEEQKELKNYPHFGSNCSEYDIIPLQNMANLAMVDETGLAKYMFAVRIDYKEE